MKLTDTFNLPRASRYSNPKNGSDILPYAYGDLTYLPVEGGVWNCVQIDDDVWLIAANAITDVNNEKGVELKVYDDDGEISTSEYTVTYSGDYESTGLTMSYLTFSTAPNGQVSIQCKGKTVSGELLENPIDIIEDLLEVMDIDESPNVSAFAKAKLAAEAQGYVAAGVIQQDQPGAYWLSNVLSSFRGDWWMNNAKEIMAHLDVSGGDVFNIAGFLEEARYLDKSATQSVSNLCNQPVVYYGPNFTNRDRRTSSGASKGDFDGYDDGESVKHSLSQWKYGVQQKSFELYWVRSPSVAQTFQGLIVEDFHEPPWLFTVEEDAFRNLHCERGDYVVASYKMLPDENGLPLRNQIWKILEIGNSDAFTISYLLKDTGQYYPEPPIYYDGKYKIGEYLGRVRERRIFPL